ncbi:AlpA family transcriptional regulator [Jatrophihabitans sp. GAS493]|uniref:helix-turn-helix transcriptional regulator n=1 Tax=Jatrophihabitans sp. GAS493 TaxID=1907575 RepID=UPI0012FD0A1F|nr:helix-turn-helix domain-containing protein [Jatrophihabitans sp. GAS493]
MTESPTVDLDQAAAICGVSKATIRKWVQRQHIRRLPGGRYDVHELLHWIDTRDPDALFARAGIAMRDRP